MYPFAEEEVLIEFTAAMSSAQHKVRNGEMSWPYLTDRISY